MNELTKREQEVVQWIANGKTTWEIAQILSITERTVYFHANNAKDKLNVATRGQIAIVAYRMGLIS